MLMSSLMLAGLELGEPEVGWVFEGCVMLKEELLLAQGFELPAFPGQTHIHCEGQL